ncbi:MAG: DUF2061 domain-containing protein [Chromatiaceae bacterium]|jgi:uncharacterized membrane protein|nr:DUF2061 domain-containing protein [Chromatiaceae bacterium]
MIKTVTFAIMHFGIAFSVAYLLTGDLVVGGAVALIEPAVNTVAYYFHDRLWERLSRRGRMSGALPA